MAFKTEAGVGTGGRRQITSGGVKKVEATEVIWRAKLREERSGMARSLGQKLLRMLIHPNKR